MIRELARAGVVALAATAASMSLAAAATPFDGSWSLTFHTRSGTCEPAYRFEVFIRNGIIRHPEIANFRGRVGRSGDVRASIMMDGSSASGSGRLTRSSGRGSWAGRGSETRCSGTWTARRR